MSERGKYIVLEGPDGAGTTTQSQLLVERLTVCGRRAIGIHEPGETALGVELARTIKNGHIGRTAMANLLLFTADRLQTWTDIIAPALASGVTVVSDRNWLSSLVYQGHAEGLGMSEVTEVTSRFLPPDYMNPDLIVIVSLSERVRQQRLAARGGSVVDTFEGRDTAFQRRLVTGYALAAERAGRHVACINGDGTANEVRQVVWRDVERVLSQ